MRDQPDHFCRIGQFVDRPAHGGQGGDPEQRLFDRLLREDICEPLGVRDFCLGLPDLEFARFAPVLIYCAPATRSGG
jgi:hypothetical protein